MKLGLTSDLQQPISFHYADLQDATGNFSDKNKLGSGGFSVVYKVCQKMIIPSFESSSLFFLNIISKRSLGVEVKRGGVREYGKKEKSGSWRRPGNDGSPAGLPKKFSTEKVD